MEKESGQASRNNASQLLVTSAESGQKLLRFLSSRLELPDSLLHRWIRTGQIRVNGGRTKPFNRVFENDVVRLPPFTAALDENTCQPNSGLPDMDKMRAAGLLEIHERIIAWEKPPFLPVHDGSGHDDSLASRIKEIFAASAYKPAPAHRLDRDTTGIVLAGLDWESQRQIQELFAQGAMRKEYLAWVRGEWRRGDALASHYLHKISVNGFEKMAVCPASHSQGRKGSIKIHPLLVSPSESLLQIRLLTGIKHQIRAQLSHMGHPILGDGKYGDRGKTPFLLDAFRIILPDGHEISRFPPWSRERLPKRLPPPLACDSRHNHILTLDAENE